MDNSGSTQQAPRATAEDWGKAFLCSAAVLILLLLLFLWPFGPPASPSIAANGDGAGQAGEGGVGGTGSGAGTGEGTGTGETGEGPGAGSSGAGQGADTTAPPTAAAGGGTTPEEPLSQSNATGEVAEAPPPAESPAETASPAAPAAPPPPPVEEPPVETEPTPPPAPERFALVAPSSTPGASAPAPVATPGLSGSSGGASPGKNVGGMFVKGSRLGVILDVSGSMLPYLENLRREIRSGFSDAIFLEVNGCSLTPTHGNVTAQRLPDPSRASVMESIRELVVENGVDSVYWFCDLQDHRSDDALHELRELVAGETIPRETIQEPPPGGGEFSRLDELKRMNQNRPRDPRKAVFHLYIRSVGQSPDPPLERIIIESGGSFQLKR